MNTEESKDIDKVHVTTLDYKINFRKYTSEVYYNNNIVSEYLDLTKRLFSKLNDYIKTINITEEQRTELLLMEAVGSSAIEGYETYTDDLQQIVSKKRIPLNKDELVAYEGYKANKKLFSEQKVDLIDSKKKLLTYWRTLLIH